MFVVVQYVIKRVCVEISACHQVQEFPEGEPSQVIALYNAVQFRVVLFKPHHAAPREYYFQLRVLVIASAQFAAPIWFFENLVNQQHLAPVSTEFACEVGYAVPLEIKIVHVHIKAAPVVRSEVLFCVLQQECSLPHAPCAFYANEPVVPVYFVHKQAAYRNVGMFYQISMGAIEGFHSFFNLLYA